MRTVGRMLECRSSQAHCASSLSAAGPEAYLRISSLSRNCTMTVSASEPPRNMRCTTMSRIALPSKSDTRSLVPLNRRARNSP